MSITQTYVMYIAIIIFSTASIWLSEHINIGCFSVVGTKKERRFVLSRGFFILVALFILIIPLVQRTCGADTAVYYYDYLHDRIYGFDTLFCYLLLFLHRYIPDPQIGLGVVSSITILLSVLSIVKLRDYINVTLAFFSYVTFIYFYSYNYIRMLFAISFIFIGYSLCVLEKRKVAVIPFAIASLFHMSTGLVLIIHILLMNFRKHRKIVIAFGIFGLLAFLAMPNAFLSLISVKRYSEQIALNQHSTIGIGTMIRILPIFWILWRYRADYKDDDRYTWILVFAVANAVFSFLGYFVGTASRISNILLVFHIIYATPLFVKEDEQKGRSWNIRWLFVVYCIMMYFIIAKNFDVMVIVPYY